MTKIIVQTVPIIIVGYVVNIYILVTTGYVLHGKVIHKVTSYQKLSALSTKLSIFHCSTWNIFVEHFVEHFRQRARNCIICINFIHFLAYLCRIWGVLCIKRRTIFIFLHIYFRQVIIKVAPSPFPQHSVHQLNTSFTK